MAMSVKEAVSLAKQYILDLFAEEDPSNVGLEEVRRDDLADEWVVTIGFSRPWDEPKNALAALARTTTAHRSYKVVRIDNASAKVTSVTNYEAAS